MQKVETYPSNYEYFEYDILNKRTWALKDENGNIWYPITTLINNVFNMKHFRLNRLTERQIKNTVRVRLAAPLSNFRSTNGVIQPQSIVLGNVWCITNIIRTKLKLSQNYKTKSRDVFVEEFAKIWDINIIGFGVLTYKQPNLYRYSLLDRITIAAESNKVKWLKCAECEKYYPATFRFYKDSGVTCEKCLGRPFIVCSDGAYERIEQMLKMGIDKSSVL